MLRLMNSFLISIRGLLFLSVVALATASPSNSLAADKTRILLIGKQADHPWSTHMYLHTLTMLGKCLEKTEGVETVVSDLWPKDPKALTDIKTIVVYSSPGAELLLNSPHAKEFDDLMKQGVGLVTIHWASSIYQGNLPKLGEQWMGYLGGTWVSNVGLSTSKSPLKQLIPEHPICRGWAPYELHDEYYLNPTIKAAKPLLQVHTKNQDVIVGWVHERKDGGRAFATTLGHYYRNFQIDAFRQMMVNGILWTAHANVPKDGAPINLSQDELALPPKPEADKK